MEADAAACILVGWLFAAAGAAMMMVLVLQLEPFPYPINLFTSFSLPTSDRTLFITVYSIIRRLYA